MKQNICELDFTNECELTLFLSNLPDINQLTTSELSEIFLQTIIFENITAFIILLTSVNEVDFFLNSSENPVLYRCCQFQFEAGADFVMTHYLTNLETLDNSRIVALKSNNLTLIRSLLLNGLEHTETFFNPFLELPINVPLEIFSFLLSETEFDPSGDTNSAFFLFNQINRRDLCLMLMNDDRVISCAFRNNQPIYTQERLNKAIVDSPHLFL